MGTKPTITFNWLLNSYSKLILLYILLALPTKSKNQTNDTDQQSDEFNNEYTQATSEIVHSKRIIVFFDLIK